MSFFNQRGLTTEQFLRDYWQQQPLLLRQAFPDFEPELDADDIAGLACDELAEARLITGGFPQHDWSVRYGPFSEEDFATLPSREWTLLVQDVEKHYPPLRSLIASFNFLPSWRIDDLMVSVAGPGGSVGPHVDQYDVFLLQAAGRRRWEISTSFDPGLLPECELNVLQKFEAQQAWDLEPGDMLYLPPGVAHHGVAKDPKEGVPGMDGTPVMCTTWSIGMRAPSAADLMQALGEWLTPAPDEGGRYRDPGFAFSTRPGEVDGFACEGMRDLLRPVIEDPDRFAVFLGAFLSRYRSAHEPAPPRQPIEPAELREALERGAVLHHNPWTRLTWLETAGGVHLFAAGSAYPCDAGMAATLCDAERLHATPLKQLEGSLDLLSELINRGHLIIETL
jgi:50S ribosomal protein L16 3-hydroxylase